jgi:arabinose-5-phosphate isomerase
MQLKIINAAKKTIELEADAIKNLENFIDNNFIAAVNTINKNKGRLVVSGIGKSSIV